MLGYKIPFAGVFYMLFGSNGEVNLNNIPAGNKFLVS